MEPHLLYIPGPAVCLVPTWNARTDPVQSTLSLGVQLRREVGSLSVSGGRYSSVSK